MSGSIRFLAETLHAEIDKLSSQSARDNLILSHQFSRLWKNDIAYIADLVSRIIFQLSDNGCKKLLLMYKVHSKIIIANDYLMDHIYGQNGIKILKKYSVDIQQVLIRNIMVDYNYNFTLYNFLSIS